MLRKRKFISLGVTTHSTDWRIHACWTCKWVTASAAGGGGREQPDISLCECHSMQPLWGCEPAFPEVEYKGHRHILWPYSLPNDFNTNACTTSQTVLCCQQSYNINLNWSTMNAHQPENMWMERWCQHLPIKTDLTFSSVKEPVSPQNFWYLSLLKTI